MEGHVHTKQYRPLSEQILEGTPRQVIVVFPLERGGDQRNFSCIRHVLILLHTKYISVLLLQLKMM